jgi:hypothetical protein
MRKHCGFLSILGLTAMMGLMASQAHAETMTLTVYAGSGTSGAVIYQTMGSANAVTADLGSGGLNDQLVAAGFGAYVFGNLGGTSNFTSSPTLEQHVAVAGGLDVTSGGAGAGTPITILVTEDGFTQPPQGKELFDGATVSFGASTGSVDNTGTFSGTPGSVSPASLTDTSNPPQSTASVAITSTPIPYTLGSMSVITLNTASGASSGNLTFTNSVAVTGVPEPASLVMMLTGIPLPLVVLGLLRRRAAA